MGYTGVNPEAIGVFGLMVTVWVFGLEQLGFGMKGADHDKVGKSLSLVAFWYGGLAQLFTALTLFLTNTVGNPGMSIYLGTIFANYGLFWMVVGCFFRFGGDKKHMAHFFFVQLLVTLVFTYIAHVKGLTELRLCLIFIDALFVVLPFLYYGVMPGLLSKLAGLINIGVGITAIPLFLKQILTVLN